MKEIENHDKHDSNYCSSQDIMIDAEISGQKLKEKQDICIVTKYPFLKYINYKEKNIVTSQWRNLANTFLTKGSG